MDRVGYRLYRGKMRGNHMDLLRVYSYRGVREEEEGEEGTMNQE